MKFCDDLHCGLMDYGTTESGRGVTTFERRILPQFASFDFLHNLNKLCASIFIPSSSCILQHLHKINGNELIS
jgi:hypothetical protein